MFVTVPVAQRYILYEVEKRLVRSAFVDPTFFVLLIGCLGLIAVLRHRVLGMAMIFLSFFMLYAFSTEYLSSRLLAFVEGAPPRSPATAADLPRAIVVLSGGMHRAPPERGGDMIGEDTLERVRHAANLYRETHLPILVAGGPMPGSTKTLAQTMSESLQRDFGIAVTWEENESQTTFENAKYSASILGAAGINSIYLVTHAAHMPRAVEIFERCGFQVVPASTGFTLPTQNPTLYSLMPRAYYLADSSRALRELIGITFYRLNYR